GAWEADLNERNYTLHKTIMNGNGSNVVVFDGSTNYTNNACGVSRDARVDGFIIRGGTASEGAGILFKNGASGTVANSVIMDNTATGFGGGIYI
ncbi:tetraacyldisaccharide 4'-kinase, partial [Tannerella forsythia]